MKTFKKLIVSGFVLLLFSCSDGSQVGTKINELIILHKVDRVVIEFECTGNESKRMEYAVDSIRIEQQFIRVGNEYVNMGKIKTVKVDGKKMNISI